MKKALILLAIVSLFFVPLAQAEEEKPIELTLTTLDRMAIRQIMPQKSDILSQSLIRSIVRRVIIARGSDVWKKAGLDGTKNNAEAFEAVAFPKMFKFSKLEILFLKDQVRRIDKEKSANQFTLDLLLKIKEVEIPKDG